jgi:hypothetical protein
MSGAWKNPCAKAEAQDAGELERSTDKGELMTSNSFGKSLAAAGKEYMERERALYGNQTDIEDCVAQIENSTEYKEAVSRALEGLTKEQADIVYYAHREVLVLRVIDELAKKEGVQ